MRSCHLQMEIGLLPPVHLDACYFFFLSSYPDWTLLIMLNRSSESRHPYFIPNFGNKC